MAQYQAAQGSRLSGLRLGAPTTRPESFTQRPEAGYSLGMELVILPRLVVNQMLDQAEASPDAEVCGLISAKDGHPRRCIAIQNVADDPQRLFTMDPRQQIDAMRKMRNRGEQLFGIYHSHPHSPAVPSGTDLQQAGYPEVLYIIISLNTRGYLEIRGYRINNGQTEEVQLEI